MQWGSKSTAKAPALSMTQKNALATFSEMVNVKGHDDVCIQYLTKAKWDINTAMDQWFSNPPNLPASKSAATKSGAFDKAKASALFKEIAAGNSKWEGDQIEAFYNKLGVDCYEDTIVLLVAYHMNSAHMGEVLENEFIKGCEVIGADSVDKWKAALPGLRKQWETSDVHKKVYLFCYDYAQEWKTNKKNVLIEDACALWEMLLTKKCNYLAKWCEFMTKKKDSGKLLVVNKDTWNMFYDLHETNGGDLAASEDDGCWPSLIDEFCREQGVFQ